jgi:K+-sensing histidine kinase KdpD
MSMNLDAVRTEKWKGAVIGAVSCLLLIALGNRMQSVAGNTVLLRGLILTAAAVSWYCGRWAGILVTAVGGLLATYFALPPLYSLRIVGTQESAELYSFALAGVIISLLCGAAWQLRVEARVWHADQQELMRLRNRNVELQWESLTQQKALEASDRLLEEIGYAASREQPRIVDCEALVQNAKKKYPQRSGIVQGAVPKVWAEEKQVQRLFETLIARAAENESVQSLQLSANRLPESYLFSATFHKTGGSPPLTPLEFQTCNYLVARQGGRCWTNAREHDWELMFMLPRRQR